MPQRMPAALGRQISADILELLKGDCMNHDDDSAGYADFLPDVGFFTAVFLAIAGLVSVLWWIVPGFAQWIVS